MTTKNIHQRIHDAMGRVDYIQKDRKQGMRYTVVSHDAVTAKVRPILHECGIVYYPVGMVATQEGNRTQVQLTVRFANVDEPADHIDVASLGYGVDESDKGPGKAISYAVKYALLKTLGLETGDDPDLDDQPAKPNGVTRPAPPPPRTAASAAPPLDPALTQNDWMTVAQDIEKVVKAQRSDADITEVLREHAKVLNSMKTHDPDRYAAVGAMVKGCRTALAPVAG